MPRPRKQTDKPRAYTGRGLYRINLAIETRPDGTLYIPSLNLTIVPVGAETTQTERIESQ